MIIAVLIYITVSALLIAGAVLFFAKALRLLLGGKPPLTSAGSAIDPNVPLSEQVSDASKRAQIIEMLERQFHSSPSVDP
jgi:hypothetical protein